MLEKLHFCVPLERGTIRVDKDAGDVRSSLPVDSFSYVFFALFMPHSVL